jgi:hypothetical protein
MDPITVGAMRKWRGGFAVSPRGSSGSGGAVDGDGFLDPGGGQDVAHFLAAERFGQEVVAAEIQDLSPEGFVGEARSNDEERLLADAGDLVEDLDPIAIREVGLAEDDAELIVGEGAGRFPARTGGRDDEG